MVSLLEIFLSAILGHLASRFVDFFANLKPPAPQEVEDRLRSVLLRAQVIIDEAMGRERITNQAMLWQLDALIGTVHRGYYTLDTFRCQTSCRREEEVSSSNGQGVSRCRPVASVFSRVGSIKDLCFHSASTGREISKDMQEVLDRVSAMLLDAHELVLFLANYSHRVDRQPYSMYLLLGNCMFDRQMEAQLVIDFLLHAQHPSVEEKPAVLPIVGSFRVGKSTLVAHVCKDERVRAYFSEIMFLTDHDFAYDGLAAFREGLCAMRQQDCGTSDYYSNKDGTTRRLLLVVDVSGNLDEDVWNRLYSASKHWMPMGSKIILTSRSDKITKLGTTEALTLKPLSHEAYWYFFRTLVFGSTDPMTHPSQLTSLAMEIAMMLNGSMIVANIFARILRDSFSVQFWGKIAAFMRSQFQRHVSKFGGHPYDLLNQNKPVYFGRIHRRSEQVVGYHQYHRHSSQQDHQVPKITLHDMTYGDAKLPRRFEALAWRSTIPPYYSYVYACEVQELKSSTGTKRKRSAKNGATLP